MIPDTMLAGNKVLESIALMNYTLIKDVFRFS